MANALACESGLMNEEDAERVKALLDVMIYPLPILSWMLKSFIKLFSWIKKVLTVLLRLSFRVESEGLKLPTLSRHQR
jgi:hypothetical protein